MSLNLITMNGELTLQGVIGGGLLILLFVASAVYMLKPRKDRES